LSLSQHLDVDGLVRSLIDLLAAIEYLVEFYRHQLNIGTTISNSSWTTSPISSARSSEVSAGPETIKAAIERVHLQVRPGARTRRSAGAEPEKMDCTRLKLAEDIGIAK
jgi:hypothetical protein